MERLTQRLGAALGRFFRGGFSRADQFETTFLGPSLSKEKSALLFDEQTSAADRLARRQKLHGVRRECREGSFCHSEVHSSAHHFEGVRGAVSKTLTIWQTRHSRAVRG